MAILADLALALTKIRAEVEHIRVAEPAGWMRLFLPQHFFRELVYNMCGINTAHFGGTKCLIYINSVILIGRLGLLSSMESQKIRVVCYGPAHTHAIMLQPILVATMGI